MRRNDFDPLAYIESAFLDRKPSRDDEKNGSVSVLPDLSELLDGPSAEREEALRFRRTSMRAPRPRRAKKRPPEEAPIDPELQAVWEILPKNIEFLCSFYDDSVTANYYRGEFKESRQDLIRRLLDPQLTLEETSRLLGVCPATVRRYTNRGWLRHHRTQGGQRRFRLSDIVRFVNEHGRFPEG